MGLFPNNWDFVQYSERLNFPQSSKLAVHIGKSHILVKFLCKKHNVCVAMTGVFGPNEYYLQIVLVKIA